MKNKNQCEGLKVGNKYRFAINILENKLYKLLEIYEILGEDSFWSDTKRQTEEYLAELKSVIELLGGVNED